MQGVGQVTGLPGAVARERETRIVVPAYSAEKTIRSCVEAIAASPGSDVCEIVVVDDGGNIDLPRTLRDLPVTIRATGGTGSAAAARNFGAADFACRYLVFVDADVLVAPDCIPALLQPLHEGRAEATVGNYARDVSGLSFAAQYKQLYIAKTYDRRNGYVRNEFWTAVGAINASIFHALGGFDSRFKGAGGEDTELGIRLTEHGHRTLAVPEATGRHRQTFTLGRLYSNDWRKGLVSVRNSLRRGNKLTDNRHAGRRDIGAVALATGVPATPCLAAITGLSGMMAAVLAILPLLGYLAARADLLRSFSSQGAWFVVRALPIMFSLDLLRLGCIGVGLAEHLVGLRRSGSAVPVVSVDPRQGHESFKNT